MQIFKIFALATQIASYFFFALAMQILFLFCIGNVSFFIFCIGNANFFIFALAKQKIATILVTWPIYDLQIYEFTIYNVLNELDIRSSTGASFISDKSIFEGAPYVRTYNDPLVFSGRPLP